jgi:hypothetical protein
MKMSEDNARNDLVKKTVVYELPGMEDVAVRRDVVYQATGADPLRLDLYTPPGEGRRPAVVFVSGYPDPGFEAFVGRKFKELGAYTSWARLVAAAGLVGVTYTNREPAADLAALLRYLRQDADALGIDPGRIGLWACSGNVPTALGALMEGGIACAALCYGYMLDLEGASEVRTAAAQFGFATPCTGRTVDDLPRDLPLFLARAGQDQTPHLNEALDRFLARALARDLPVSLVNHATGPHAFDLFDDGAASREVIRAILEFLRFHLLGGAR